MYMMRFTNTKKNKNKKQKKECKHFNDCDNSVLIKLTFQLGFHHVYSVNPKLARDNFVLIKLIFSLVSITFTHVNKNLASVTRSDLE